MSVKMMFACAASVVALSGCGGGEGCVSRSDFDAWVAQGVITARPELRAGDVWADPVVLRRTRTLYGTSTYVASGPYYTAGETPSWVCQ